MNIIQNPVDIAGHIGVHVWIEHGAAFRPVRQQPVQDVALLAVHWLQKLQRCCRRRELATCARLLLLLDADLSTRFLQRNRLLCVQLLALDRLGELAD